MPSSLWQCSSAGGGLGANLEHHYGIISSGGVLGPDGAATTIHHDATLDLLTIYVGSNARTNNMNVRVRVNGSDANNVIVVPGGATGVFQDTTGVDSVAAGASIRGYALGSGFEFDACIIRAVSIRVTPTDPALTVSRFACGSAGTPQSTDARIGLLGQIDFDTVAGTSLIMRASAVGRMRHAAAIISSNSRNGAGTITLLVDEAATALAIAIPASTTGVFTSDATDVAVGVESRLLWQSAIGGSSGQMFTHGMQVSLETEDGTWASGLGQLARLLDGPNTVFYFPGGLNTGLGAAVPVPVLVDGRITGLGVMVSGNSAVGSTLTWVTDGTPSPTATVSIPASTTGYFAARDATEAIVAGALCRITFNVPSGALFYNHIDFGALSATPDIVTLAAVNVSPFTATLRGLATPNGIPIDGYFRWGTDNPPTEHTTDAQALGDGESGVLFQQLITGLTPNTTYYFVAIANGGSEIEGDVLSFTTPDVIQRVTQIVRQLGIDEDAEPPTVTSCTGGGEIPDGTTPVDGTSLSTATTPHAWVEVTIAGTTYRWAGKSIPHGDPKSPRVLSWGSITRALTDSYGGVEESKATIRLSDVDHQLRTLHDTVTLRNAPASIYVADEATIRAGGAPWRVFRGRVCDFRPESDLTYTLVLEDLLSALLFSAHAAEKPLPAVLVEDQFGDLGAYDEVLYAPAPWLYGSLQSLAPEDDPYSGTVLASYVGTGLIPGHEDRGAQDVFMLGIGVATKIVSLQLADPTELLVPQRRTVSIAEYGSRIFVPSQPGWIGSPWTELDGRRYTLIYLDPNHTAAILAREGRIPIIANLCGYDEVGDASGGTINKLPRQLAHLLNNMVLQDATGNWLAQAMFGGESAISTDSVERCVQIGEARLPGSPVSGYVGAFVHGHSYQQVTLRDTIQQACRSGDLDLGISRHGQILFVMLDREDDAAGSAHFNQQDHVLKGSFRIDPKTDEVENEVRYVYARNYVPALHGEHTIEVRLPREPYDADWLSGLQRIPNEASITALGGRPQGLRQSRVLEFDMVRDPDVADDVAAQYLARVSPPNGRAEATFSLLATQGLSVELGDVIRVTHTHGVGAAGWVAQRVQVRRVQVDLDRMTVTVTARDVDDLLP